MVTNVTAEPFSEQAAAFEPGGALELIVPQDVSGAERLDRWLATRVRDCSRSYFQKLIRSGNVLLDGAAAKASKPVAAGQRLSISFPETEPEPNAVPEDIPVPVLHEDDDLLIVNKPAGMATHPSCGHARGTLANAMVFRCNRLSEVNGPVRPGIVHRLDMDTSGLLVVAKTDKAHRELARQFADREVSKRYVALVHGSMSAASGEIEKQLGRHPKKRKKQAVLADGGRSALTRYDTLERLGRFSHMELRPRTGRTHQLRVHLASSGCPILCDALYGREDSYPADTPVLTRQALHAAALAFTHPTTSQQMRFEATPPDDYLAALELLRGSDAPERT